MFSENKRTDERTKQQDETDFEFIDRSPWQAMSSVRELILNCLENIEESERSELISRIRSRHGFASATFELMIHEVFRRKGFEIEIHPDLPNGSNKHPDFLLKDPNGEEFYLEAVLASEQNENDDSILAIKERVMDQLRNTTHPDFSTAIQTSGDPTKSPRGSQFARQVASWLNSLDYERLRTEFETHGLKAMPVQEWNLDGWLLKVTAYPISRESRGKEHGLLGMYDGGDASWINSWLPLRNAIRTKGARYGELDKPLVVAVNFQRGYLDEIDQIQALYGEEIVVYQPGSPHLQPTLERDNNGAWMGRSGPEGKRVSAAWVFTNLLPYTASSSKQTLHLNPWANFKTPESMKEFRYSELHEGRQVTNEGISVGEVLELPSNWPGDR
ncbi:hypothetical protein N9850_11930 [Granulosicoccus sp.]|nr:hypothetical protein [Granulosicoccus sp.]MDB4224477.1 hypothetical protein [Granulosicoccus sp.]